MGFVEALGNPPPTVPGDQSRLDVKAMFTRLRDTNGATIADPDPPKCFALQLRTP